MAGLFAKLRSLFDGDKGVRRVADDPALTAELLLLFRMILADGVANDRELEALRRICRESFGIAESSMDEAIEFLTDYGYETSGTQAIGLFEELDIERRRSLARHLAEIAKADETLALDEVRLLKRALDVLGLEAADIRA